METSDLKVGQKIVVGNFDSDYSAKVVSNENGKIIVEIDFYGRAKIKELDSVNFWLAGMIK